MRHCNNMGIVAMLHCGNAMVSCYNIVAMRFLWPGSTSCSLCHLVVAPRPLVFDDGGARCSPERSMSLGGSLRDL